MKAAEWAAQSQKKLEKRAQARALARATSPNFRSYLANFRAALSDLNYDYGTVRRWASDQKIHPDYNPYAKATNREYIFTADGWRPL